MLCKAGVIEDGTKIWWDIRPSARFPTLEMRITDACPLIEDGLCIAAVFRCLCRALTRAPSGKTESGRSSSPFARLAFINENRWRAQRYGIDQGMVHPIEGRIASYGELMDDLLEMIHLDAVFFDCVDEVEHARVILARGTSADRQIALYHRLLDQDHSLAEAMRGVVDQLVAETAVSRYPASEKGVARNWPSAPTIASPA